MKKLSIRRIGRFWIDQALIEEGYGQEDFEEEEAIELPELLDPEKKKNVGWLWCPQCHEKTQVNKYQPVCGNCGWSEQCSA